MRNPTSVRLPLGPAAAEWTKRPSQISLLRHLPTRAGFAPKASGRSNVYVPIGVRIECDAEHGEFITIDYRPGLNMAIAFRLVRKPGRLAGDAGTLKGCVSVPIRVEQMKNAR
jgi:hypothetical protein